MYLRNLTVLVLLMASLSGVGAAPEHAVRSGAALLEQCTDPSGKVRLSDGCVSYFESALDMLATLERHRQAFPICLPAPLETQRLVELFVLESRIYPDVLEVRATDLIVGMLVKFFPCRAA